jgi:hypothetical protein
MVTFGGFCRNFGQIVTPVLGDLADLVKQLKPSDELEAATS